MAGRLLERFERFGDWMAAVSLLVMMVVISLDALGRFMGHPLQGAYELSELYLMVIVAVLFTLTRFFSAKR